MALSVNTGLPGKLTGFHLSHINIHTRTRLYRVHCLCLCSYFSIKMLSSKLAFDADVSLSSLLWFNQLLVQADINLLHILNIVKS